MSGAKEALEIVITGTAELVEDVIKLRLGKIARLATGHAQQRAARLRDQSTALGSKLGLIPEMRRAFPGATKD